MGEISAKTYSMWNGQIPCGIRGHGKDLPLSLPCDQVKHQSEEDTPVFNVPGLLYHKPLEVIKAAFQEPAAEQLHLSPFEEYWKPVPDSPPEHIYSELYNSDAFILEHEKIRSQSNPECHLEMVIAAIMV